MKKELLRAGIGVGAFVLLLAGVVLFRPQTQTPIGEQGADVAASSVATEEQSGSHEAGAFLGEQLVPPQSAPDFTLTDRSGARVRMRDFQGKLVLLSFAFTSCPDVCPMLFSRFLGVQEELAGHLDQDLVLVFISVDPDADTPERLDEHTRAMGGQWYFLTGSLPTMQDVWQAYRVHVEKEGVLVAHTTVTYLIDRNGLMQVRYPGVPPAKVFITDIEKMLK